jgi:hypothetical protein
MFHIYLLGLGKWAALSILFVVVGDRQIRDSHGPAARSVRST